MSRLTPETVSNLHGVLRVGLEAGDAPKEVVEAADRLFFELARRAGFPLVGIKESHKCPNAYCCEGGNMAEPEWSPCHDGGCGRCPPCKAKEKLQ